MPRSLLNKAEIRVAAFAKLQVSKVFRERQAGFSAAF
jgi:hypothetical protein